MEEYSDRIFRNKVNRAIARGSSDVFFYALLVPNDGLERLKKTSKGVTWRLTRMARAEKQLTDDDFLVLKVEALLEG